VSVGGAERSADMSDSLRPSVDGTRPVTRHTSTLVQQLVGCVFGGAVALSLLIVAAFVLCRRGRRSRRRATITKATAAAAVAGARSASTFRLFGVATSMSRDDSATLTSTCQTTSNGNCSVSVAADNDDDDYDASTLARCFRLPHDVIQTRQLPKPPPPPLPPCQSQYLTGVSFLFSSSYTSCSFKFCCFVVVSLTTSKTYVRFRTNISVGNNYRTFRDPE